MLKYLKNSEISFRVGLNPFNWKIIPAVAYDGPNMFYPKRRTYAFAFLFLQAFLDVDDGTNDLDTVVKLFNPDIEVKEENEQSEVGHTVSPASVGSLNVE